MGSQARKMPNALRAPKKPGHTVAFPELWARWSLNDQRVMDSLPLGVALLHLSHPENVQSWRLAALNAKAARVIGSSIHDFLENPLTANFPRRDQDLAKVYRDALRSAKPRELGSITEEHPGGSSVSYLIKAFPIPENWLAITVEDVSLYVQTRRTLTEIETHYHHLCQSVHVIIWRADPETLQFKFVNREAERILGYWVERWYGEVNFWKKHLHPEDREAVVSLCAKAARDGRQCELDHRMIAADGGTVWFHTSVDTSNLAGFGPELTGVMADITARKEAEDAARKLSAKLMKLQDEERRRISIELHDSLGQTLSAVKINLSLLDRFGQADPRGRVALDESMEMLDDCVKDVRTYSYLLHPPTLEIMGLGSALEWYTDGLSRRSGIKIELEVRPLVGRLGRELELALFRIAQESLMNVYRHSGSRSASVRLYDSPERVVLEIEDYGTGIPRELLKGVETASGEGPGGIGLRGMGERVRELNGKLDIKSGKNGTLVRVSIPLAPA
jgi:PAS domain S-box-containing protein